MRFKYYLRGAGIGVIVATLILSVAFLFQDNISDEEVIRRAMKLGMVMEENAQGTLADLQQPGVTQADMETGTDDGPNPDKDALSPDENTMDTLIQKRMMNRQAVKTIRLPLMKNLREIRKEIQTKLLTAASLQMISLRIKRQAVKSLLLMISLQILTNLRILTNLQTAKSHQTVKNLPVMLLPVMK